MENFGILMLVSYLTVEYQQITSKVNSKTSGILTFLPNRVVKLRPMIPGRLFLLIISTHCNNTV